MIWLICTYLTFGVGIAAFGFLRQFPFDSAEDFVAAVVVFFVFVVAYPVFLFAAIHIKND
jgi:hypothetical protein